MGKGKVPTKKQIDKIIKDKSKIVKDKKVIRK